jgi:hypothetical protein
VTEHQTSWEITEVCRASVDSLLETGGDPPVSQAIEQALSQIGVLRPDEHARTARALGYISFDGELAWPTPILPTVSGYYLAYPRDQLLHHYFRRVVRALGDRPDSETLVFLTEAQPVIVFANELEPLRDASPVETKVVGRLLDVEPFGRVEWSTDP